MSLRIATSEWIASSLLIGETSLGVLGSNIPSSGTNGASFLYNDLSLPADANKEIRALILTYPSAGTLYTYEDGSFTFTGAPDGTYTFMYQLYVDGILTGSPATVTMTVGSGMVANAQVVATSAANLTTNISLASNVTANSSGAGSLTTAVQLVSSALASSSITANLATSIKLFANGVSAATSSGNLSTNTPLAANAVGNAVATASLIVDNLISSVATAQSTVVATLSTQVVLQAYAQGLATGTATLTVTGPGQISASAKLYARYMG